MADGPSIGTAYLRIAGDFTQVNTQAVGLFKSDKWSKLGKAAGAGLAVGIAAGGAAKALYDIGAAFDEVSDTIRIKTGATGKELAKLEGSFKKVVSTVPTDFDTAAQAVAGLNQRLGLTGKPLTQLSRQITQLSKVTGSDIQENVSSITRLFGDWSVKTDKQSTTLDKLYRLTQDTGIGFSDLSRLMVQFGSPLRQLGFRFDEAAVMFARFEREGVNMQTLLPGLRFALKNIVLPSDELGKSFKQLGINTKDPHEALLQIFDLLSKDKISEADQTFLASSVFGGRAWADMKAAIEEGRFEFNDLISAMKSGDETIAKSERQTRDFSEQWTLFTNRLKVFVEPVATAVFKAVGAAMKALNKLDFRAVIKSMQEFWQKAGFLRNVLGKVFDGIRTILSGFKQFVTGIVKVIGGILTGDFGKAWRGVKDIFSSGVKNIVGILKVVTTPIRAAAEAIGKALSGVFGGAWDKITGIFKSGANALKDIVNWIISNVINRIPGVEIGTIGGAPSGGGGHGGSANLAGEPGHGAPKFFSGGKVNAPMAIVGEEAPAHPEYVLATNPKYRQRNVALWGQAAKELGIPGFAAGGSMKGVTPVSGAGFVGKAFGSVGSYLGKLDDAPFGSLPGFMAGTGDWVKDRFADYIKDKVKSVADVAATGLTQADQSGSTLKYATIIRDKFGLSLSSTYRSPAHNAAVGGVPGSLHTHGSMANPGAIDMVGAVASMMSALNYARGHFPVIESMVHDVGSGLHLHMGFFKKGGVRGKGTGLGLGGLSNLNIDQLATLAAKVGMPNPALMAAVAMAESSGNPAIIGDGGDSIGLWQINTPAWPQFPASRLKNPIYNAKAAKHVLSAQGLGAWSVYNSGAYRQFLGGNVLAPAGGSSGGGGKPKPPKPVTPPASEHPGPWSGTVGYQHLPESLAKALKGLRRKTSVLDEKILSAGILDAMATSPDGGELSDSERAGEISLNKALLRVLVARVKYLGKGIAFAPGGPRAKRLREELVTLQGLTGNAGRILDVRATLDALGASTTAGATETSETDSMRADLLQQLLDEERRTGAVLRSQMPIFQGFARAPFGGSFADGGVVPGPQGAPRTIVAHGGESVGMAGDIHVHIGDREVTDIVKVEVRDEFGRIIRSSSTAGGVVGMKAG